MPNISKIVINKTDTKSTPNNNPTNNPERVNIDKIIFEKSDDLDFLFDAIYIPITIQL
tara:strand:+ start:4838 stop:5011 length:174 start_codon:yes stop_codon:yes gene_type:complete